MRFKRSGIWGLVWALCGTSVSAAEEDVRDLITFDELVQTATSRVVPLDNRYFAPIGVSGSALHQLNGKLAIGANDSFAVKGRFPRFEVRFFTHEGYLVPTERDLISTDDSSWDIILSPGRIWSEEADRGWSRAAFPFVLAGRTWNESHNGVATFVFNHDSVSNLRIQIVQEAASWARFDAAGQLPLEYVLAESPDAAEFRSELARRLPMEPLASLDERVAPSLLGSFEGKAGHVTTAGLVVDGVLYSTGCHTRFGDYPFCREMRHGVYSVTKTVGGALSLFWLANRYGDSVADELIADHLDVTAEHDGWAKVTFLDTLNMATGVGDKAPSRVSTGYDFEADEGSPVFDKTAKAPSLKAKLEAAFEAGNYDWGPGEVGRYNSVHTFVLAAAMDAYLKQHEGVQVNLWDRVREEVLNPIGVTHAPMMHTREPDGSRGVPIMGWGFFPTVEDLARIALLFHERGRFEGRQLISGALLESVYPSPTQGGYEIAWRNVWGTYRYHKSFWLAPFQAQAGCRLQVPQMMGYGGNLVVLMPNGATAIRLADAPEDSNGMYDASDMMRVSDTLTSFCK